MPASPNFVSAQIDASAATYSETWSVAVVESPSPSRTLHGATRSVAVGTLQSGSGTTTLVFALSPTGGVASSDTVTVDIAADSVRNASSGVANGAVAGAAVTNKSGLTLSARRGSRRISMGLGMRL